MTQRTVYCQKLKQQLPGLDTPPFKNATGERIYNNISEQAWDMWLAHQTMLINEYRLNLIERSTKDFLDTEREKFLFEDKEEKPPGYTE